MYSDKKSKKLVKEFKYLIGKSYYPLGKEGREFKITELKSKLSLNKTPHMNRNEKSDLKHEQGDNWKVVLTISESNDKMSVNLKECLTTLSIRHDIDKLFND